MVETTERQPNDADNSITNLGDLLEVAANVFTAFQNQAWWRGHGLAKWSLVPKVFWDDLGPKYEPNVAIGFSGAPSR